MVHSVALIQNIYQYIYTGASNILSYPITVIIELAFQVNKIKKSIYDANES